jgi:ribosome recycling factor
MTPDIQSVLKAAEDHMKKSLAHYDELFGKIRAGKASPAFLEPVRVDYYGAPTPIKHVATIGVSDSRTLMVQPFEPKMAKAIEKAIAEANLGLQTAMDGNQLRVIFPPLTEENRKRLVKQVHELAEEGRVAIRNVRRDHLESLRQLSKKGVAEDFIRKGQEELDKITKKYIDQMDRLAGAKESELMTV